MRSSMSSRFGCRTSEIAGFGGTGPGFQLLREEPFGAFSAIPPSSKEYLPHRFSVLTYSESESGK